MAYENIVRQKMSYWREGPTGEKLAVISVNKVNAKKEEIATSPPRHLAKRRMCAHFPPSLDLCAHFLVATLPPTHPCAPGMAQQHEF